MKQNVKSIGLCLTLIALLPGCNEGPPPVTPQQKSCNVRVYADGGEASKPTHYAVTRFTGSTYEVIYDGELNWTDWEAHEGKMTTTVTKDLTTGQTYRVYALNGPVGVDGTNTKYIDPNTIYGSEPVDNYDGSETYVEVHAES